MLPHVYKTILKGRKIELIGDYVPNVSTPHHCLVCDHTWSVRPSSVADNKSGCPNCAKQALTRRLRARSEQDFRAFVKTSNWKLIGPYLGAKIPTQMQCKTCKSVLMRRPEYIRNPSICGVCRPRKRGISVGPKLRFEALCKERGYTILNYAGTNKHATLKCAEGHTWKTAPTVIESGSGCPTCVIPEHTGYRQKTFNIGKREFKVQGYEGHAIHWLVRSREIDPKNIEVGRCVVPRFRYRLNGKEHWYYPDIKVDDRIVEVKSTWTMGLLGDYEVTKRPLLAVVKKKARAVERAGFQFRLMLIKKEGTETFLAKLPDNWLNLSRTQINRDIKWLNITKRLPKNLR